MRIEVYDYGKLNFVELNITGDNDNYHKIDSESLFLDSEVFTLFTECFEASNKLYDYYIPTKYNSRKIIPLRNELIKHLEELEEMKKLEDFTGFISRVFLGTSFIESLEKIDPNWEENWNTYFGKLKEINKSLINLTDRCADEEKILWVLGY